MIGIVSYGFYLPIWRITTKEIASVWGKNYLEIENSLLVKEKTIASTDEDSLTMAFESASLALKNFPDEKEKIKFVFFGSETPPYAVNPASTILAEFLGLKNDYLANDHQFACKAATGALIEGLGLIKSNIFDYGLVVASDKATGKPHDALEYTAASGSVALIIGKKNVALEIIDQQSFSSDTPDFWRREGIRYPSHGGRFTGKPSYFHHIHQASKILLEKTKLKPKDFQYAVFHMPNGKFPQEVAFGLGFEKKQIEKSLVAPYLGNSYTASALMGLISVLEVAKKDDLIFFCSYGSGAGSDAFIFKVTQNLDKVRLPFTSTTENKKYVDYPTYLKFMGTI
jgi:hydroxymethylglutaryl-CoA synthase